MAIFIPYLKLSRFAAFSIYSVFLDSRIKIFFFEIKQKFTKKKQRNYKTTNKGY